MNAFFKYIRSDKILLFSCSATTGFLLLTMIIIFFFYKNLPPFIPIFNQMPWGVNRLGTKDQLFIPIFIALLVLLLNSTLATTIYEKTPLVARILGVTCVLISFFIFLFTIKAVQLVL